MLRISGTIALPSVRHALLALLSEGPKYGFQLRQEFEEGTGDVWPLNIGQVYSTLQRLEHSGHIESDDLADEGPQKVFRLTEIHRLEGCPGRPASRPLDPLTCLQVFTPPRSGPWESWTELLEQFDLVDPAASHCRPARAGCDGDSTSR